MRKRANGNNDGEILTLKQASCRVNLGSGTVRMLANKCGAALKIGRSYRINIARLVDYLSTITNGEEGYKDGWTDNDNGIPQVEDRASASDGLDELDKYPGESPVRASEGHYPAIRPGRGDAGQSHKCRIGVHLAAVAGVYGVSEERSEDLRGERTKQEEKENLVYELKICGFGFDEIAKKMNVSEKEAEEMCRESGKRKFEELPIRTKNLFKRKGVESVEKLDKKLTSFSGLNAYMIGEGIKKTIEDLVGYEIEKVFIDLGVNNSDIEKKIALFNSRSKQKISYSDLDIESGWYWRKSDKKAKKRSNDIIELKPCPFCGVVPELLGRERIDYVQPITNEIKDSTNNGWSKESIKEYWVQPRCVPSCIYVKIHSRAFGDVGGIRYTSRDAAAKAWNKRRSIKKNTGKTQK